MKYALLNLAGDRLGVREFRDDAPPDAELSAKGLRWLPYARIEQSFDRATQIITGPVRTLHPDRDEDVWTVRDKTAQELLDELNARRDNEVGPLSDMEAVLRAVLLIVLDEFNAHAAKINEIRTAVVDAANYGAARTAVTAIAPYPTRTAAQLVTAIRNRLGSA